MDNDIFDYLMGEGIDFFDAVSSDLPSAGVSDLIDDALAVMRAGVASLVRKNIFSDYRTMRAVVLYPFLLPPDRLGQFSPAAAGTHPAGQGNVRLACFARCPTLHSTLTNPFTLKTDQEKFAAIKDHPVFVSSTPIAPSATAVEFIVPGSIIEVDFEDRENFKGGILKNVLTPMPSALPQWAKNIPGAEGAFRKGLKTFGAGVSRVGTSGGSYEPYPDAAIMPWNELQSHSANSITQANPPVCTYTGNYFGPGKSPVFPASTNNLGALDSKRESSAIDNGAPTGTPVYAMMDGTIRSLGPHIGLCGGTVMLEFKLKADTIRATHCHLSVIPDVSSGHAVKRGDIIGLSGGERHAPGAGNTFDPHLHIEFEINGKAAGSAEVIDTFGWDFSAKNLHKSIVGNSSCEGN